MGQERVLETVQPLLEDLLNDFLGPFFIILGLVDSPMPTLPRARVIGKFHGEWILNLNIVLDGVTKFFSIDIVAREMFIVTFFLLSSAGV